MPASITQNASELKKIGVSIAAANADSCLQFHVKGYDQACMPA